MAVPLHSLYTRVDVMGMGAYGKVYRYDRKAKVVGVSEYQRSVAVKEIFQPGQKRQIVVLQREVRSLKKLRHTNIVRYFGCIMLREGILGIVMELCEATLDDLIKSTRSVKLFEVAAIHRQILEALKYMHELGILHRDLKPSNILICPDNETPGICWDTVDICTLTVKIGDFGSSRLIENLGADASQTLQMTLTGTWDYMPPEIRSAIFEQKALISYNQTADIYSAAYSMLTLYIGQIPDLWEFSIEKLSSISGLPPEALFVQFSVAQLDPDPSKRGSAQQMLGHAFLSASYGELLESKQDYSRMTLEGRHTSGYESYIQTHSQGFTHEDQKRQLGARRKTTHCFDQGKPKKVPRKLPTKEEGCCKMGCGSTRAPHSPFCKACGYKTSVVSPTRQEVPRRSSESLLREPNPRRRAVSPIEISTSPRYHTSDSEWPLVLDSPLRGASTLPVRSSSRTDLWDPLGSTRPPETRVTASSSGREDNVRDSDIDTLALLLQATHIR